MAKQENEIKFNLQRQWNDGKSCVIFDFTFSAFYALILFSFRPFVSFYFCCLKTWIVSVTNAQYHRRQQFSRCEERPMMNFFLRHVPIAASWHCPVALLFDRKDIKQKYQKFACESYNRERRNAGHVAAPATACVRVSVCVYVLLCDLRLRFWITLN